MKTFKYNLRALVSVTVLYLLLTLSVVFLITSHTLDLDTARVLDRISQISSTATSSPSDDVTLLPASANTAATRAIQAGAPYARTLSGTHLTITVAVVSEGRTIHYLQVKDMRTSTTFTTGMIATFTLILYFFSLYGIIHRAQNLRRYTSNTVAKIRNIERSPLTQNYLITKDDDPITTALNHLGETIQTRITSNTETKENLYEFIEFFQFPIFVYDGKGRIHRANASFQNEFGLQKTIDIFSPYPDFLKFLVDKMMTPDIQNHTFYFESIHSYYDVYFNPLEKIQNRYLVAMNDVTHYHQMLQAHNAFIANVSHELKTPLTSIRGFSEILEANAELSADSKKQATIIRKESERLIALVADTLLLTKQVTRISTSTVDLSALTKEIVATFTPQVTQKALTLSVNVAPLIFKTNQALVHAIFKNLIENAVYYTPQKGQISVSLQRATDHVQFSVTDTGPGLSEIEKTRIFERFYRTDESTASNKNGTGLGLAIVEKNVQDLGGHIEVFSKLGEGTTFLVTL